MLCFIHVGDLHVTTQDRPNVHDLGDIVAQANRRFLDGVDFLFLPGDNADEGRRAPAGADAYAIGAWAAKNIHGGQLGPNKNGRKW